MSEIFGENLFEKLELDYLFRQLAGIEDDKPFECVGTRQEVIMALMRFIQSGGTGALINKHKDTIIKIYEEQKMDYQEFIHRWVPENNVPAELAGILKEIIQAWE